VTKKFADFLEHNVVKEFKQVFEPIKNGVPLKGLSLWVASTATKEVLCKKVLKAFFTDDRIIGNLKENLRTTFKNLRELHTSKSDNPMNVCY